MPVEENKELRDLVTDTLQAKGVLGKVQAEIRASVFLALEEQEVFKDRNPFLNKQLKEFLTTNDGLLIISLVREFLEFFNLEFSSMVFDPETHAGIDYSYQGRVKLAKELMLNEDEQDNQPLLALLIGAIKTNSLKMRNSINNFGKEKQIDLEHEKSLNGMNGDYVFQGDGDKKKNEDKYENAANAKETQGLSSLTSLSNLPPLGKPLSGNTDITDYNLKEILDLGISSNDDEEFLTQLKKQTVKNDEKNSHEAESEESEVEEELSRNSIHSTALDENTADITISKASGHGDYFEDSGRQNSTVHKKKIISKGDGDKKSEISVSNRSPDLNQKTDNNPLMSIPPEQMVEKCDLSNSTLSERVDIDDSRCDTISEIDEIEEFSTNLSISDNPENPHFIIEDRSSDVKSNKINDMFGNVKTLQTIDNAVTQIVKKKIPHLADLPLKDEIVIINQVDDAKEGVHRKKSVESVTRIIPTESRNVASVITQNDITIKINENKNQDSDRVMVGGQQLDKEEYKSIFQELEKGLGAKIESIFIPEEPKIQVTLTSPPKHDMHFRDPGKKPAYKDKNTHNSHGDSIKEEKSVKIDQDHHSESTKSVDSSRLQNKRSLSRSPDKQEIKGNDTKSSISQNIRNYSKTESLASKRSASKEKSEKGKSVEEKIPDSVSQSHKSDKHEVQNTQNETNSARNRGSIGEKLKQVDTTNLDSFFKFGVDTSYEEFCKFKSEMLRLKGYHASKDDSSCSLTSVSSCSKGKCEEKETPKEETPHSEGKTVSPIPKVLPPLKMNAMSRKKPKSVLEHAQSKDEDKSYSHSKKSKSVRSDSRHTVDIENNHTGELEEKTQDISLPSVSGVGDYMEPVSFSTIPPRF